MTRARIHAITIVLASLLMIPLAALQPGTAAQGITELGAILGFVAPGGNAADHFAMQANLELDVLADGTLAVRQVRGTATLQARDAVEHQVWRVESATVSGFVIRPDDGGEAVLVLEVLTFGLARLDHATPGASDADHATLVVVAGPAEPPASSNGWYVAKPTFTLSSGDTTLSGDGILRYRLVDRTSS